jgi:hypothetical protein
LYVLCVEQMNLIYSRCIAFFLVALVQMIKCVVKCV